LVKSLALTLVGVLAPRLAYACPSCAGNPDGGIARYVLVGLMIFAPYVASTVVIRLIRNGEAAMRAREGVSTRATD
jgi:hypothetical protein